MKKNKRIVFNDENYHSLLLKKENSSNDEKNEIQLENIVQSNTFLYFLKIKIIILCLIMI